MEIELGRKWNFYLFTIIFPSLLFTCMSYVGLWVDKNGVPGRTLLGSFAIINNITVYILPDVASFTWISKFLLGCLIFGVFTMIEYCILNYCTFTFNAMNITIEEMITQINSDDIAQEHEFQVLAEVRRNKYVSKSTKNLDDRIQIVEEVVLYNKHKELTLGNKGNLQNTDKYFCKYYFSFLSIYLLEVIEIRG